VEHQSPRILAWNSILEIHCCFTKSHSDRWRNIRMRVQNIPKWLNLRLLAHSMTWNLMYNSTDVNFRFRFHCKFPADRRRGGWIFEPPGIPNSVKFAVSGSTRATWQYTAQDKIWQRRRGLACKIAADNWRDEGMAARLQSSKFVIRRYPARFLTTQRCLRFPHVYS